MTDKSTWDKMKLKGKPKCPFCGNALIFVYEGSIGYSAVKCKRCSHESIVNTETLEVAGKPAPAR